ncbi:MAG: zf-HC2 domain-containing protein [Phycisphaerales bacterium]
MNGPCGEFADRIIDYVDGELPEDEARAVADHLAACESCRRTVDALNRSLGLAKVLWSDNLGDSKSAVQPALMPRSRRIWIYAVAASIVIAVLILVSMISDRHLQQPSFRFEEVERQIARVGAAAELLAATQIIARCEGTEAIVERQHQFILKEYAGTPAAESIRAQHGSRLGGTHNE